VRKPQTRYAKLDPELVEVGHHLQLLRRGHAPEALDLDRMNRLVHFAAHLIPRAEAANVVRGQPVRNVEALANPEALEQFPERAELGI